MYLCFESDDKRSVFPEGSLIAMDENGFTFKAGLNNRTGAQSVFLRLNALQGTVQTFAQAMNWVKRVQGRTKTAESLPTTPSF